MIRSLAAAGSATLLVVLTSATVPSVADGGRSARTVELQDDCDPVTFNAALGEGACVGDGDTTFDELLASLVAHDPDGHWRNHPDELSLKRGRMLAVENTGGEFHTFTEVAAFGPGCVPEINALLGLEGPPAADCEAAFGDPETALPPGGRGHVDTHHLRIGRHRFMCMIHPWMHTELRVRRP